MPERPEGSEKEGPREEQPDDESRATLVEEEEGNENGGLEALKQRRVWEFQIDTADGQLVTFRGSEPETEDQVAQLISPTDNASLMFKRAVDFLNEEPAISDEDWEEFSPTNKAYIASSHLDEWGADQFVSDEDLEQARRKMIDQQSD